MPSKKKKSPVQPTTQQHYLAPQDDLTFSMQSLSINYISQDDPAHVLADFFARRGSFAPNHPDRGSKQQKLLLWQSILVRVGLCYDSQGTPAMPGLLRPSNFPKVLLPLPSSLSGCKKLIKNYVFFNIFDMKRGEGMKDNRKSGAFVLFASPHKLIDYTKKDKRFYPLALAKEQMLNPFLWDMHYRGRGGPRFLREDDDDSD